LYDREKNKKQTKRNGYVEVNLENDEGWGTRFYGVHQRTGRRMSEQRLRALFGVIGGDSGDRDRGFYMGDSIG